MCIFVHKTTNLIMADNDNPGELTYKKKRIKITSCCIKNCFNTNENSPGLEFYPFPTSKVEYRAVKLLKWIYAINQKKPDGTLWEPKSHSKICSQHFIGNKKSEHPLSPSYVPTIFPGRKRDLKKETALVHRFNLMLKRKAVSENATKSSKGLLPVKIEHLTEPKPKRLPNKKKNCDVQIKSEKCDKALDKANQINFPCSKKQIALFICNMFIGPTTTDTQTQVETVDYSRDTDHNYSLTIKQEVC